MNIVELQKEVSDLPEREQDVLAAYLTMLRRSRDPEWDLELARRLGMDVAEDGAASGRASEG